MARDWESTFREWSKPSSATEQQKSDNAEKAIKAAIAESPELSKRNVIVFPQGSYRNNTNVRQDSDVDICVLCKDVSFYDLPSDESVTKTSAAITDAHYEYSTFKNEVEIALVRKFGRNMVKRENKAFDIHENTYRVDADAVACFLYREYYRYNNGQIRYRQGTELHPDDGGRIINWPDQHYENGVAKNNSTSGRFKFMTRVIKRLRNEMEEKNILEAKPVPSYLIECLLWNTPNNCFGNCNCSGIKPRYMGLTGENAGESVEDRVTLLTQRREVATNAAEVISAVRATKTAGDLVLDFQHPQIALSLIVVKWHPEVVEEGQHGRAMRHQPVEQIAGRGLLGTSTLPGRLGGWVGPQSFSHESGEGGLVTGQPLGGQGRLSGGAGCRNHPLHAQQQPDEFLHPGLAGLFVQANQLTQQMGVTQGIQPGQAQVRRPGVVHPPTREIQQQANGFNRGAAALGMMRIESQERRADHVHPGCVPGHPHACFVDVRNVRYPQGLPNDLLHPCQLGVGRLLGRGQRAFRRVDPKQIPHCFGGALVGQELVGLQIHRRGLRPWAILNRLGHLGRKFPRRHRLAYRANLLHCLMFGHSRTRQGDLDHLPPFLTHRSLGGQRCPTASAHFGHMRNNHLGIIDQKTGQAGMTVLATTRLAAAQSQAARVGSLRRSIARRRLMAVMAIFVQLGLQCLDCGRQRLDLRRQYLDLLFQGGLSHQQLLDQSHHGFWPSLVKCSNLVATQHRIPLYAEMLAWQA